MHAVLTHPRLRPLRPNPGSAISGTRPVHAVPDERFGHQPHSPGRGNSTDVNLYVSLSECHPLSPIESYLTGVPALMS